MKLKLELEAALGWNKVALLYDEGKHIILNEQKGNWIEGAWFSSWRLHPSVVVPLRHWQLHPRPNLVDCPDALDHLDGRERSEGCVVADGVVLRFDLVLIGHCQLRNPTGVCDRSAKLFSAELHERILAMCVV